MFGKQAVQSSVQASVHKPSGVEMMLRSLGLGEVMNEIKKLADSGALEEIAKFAAEAKKIRETNELILRELQALRGKLEETDDGRHSLEPGSGSDDGFRDRQLVGPTVRAVGAD